MDYKQYISKLIKLKDVTEEEIYAAIALPPNSEMGDYALHCFKFAKILITTNVRYKRGFSGQRIS